MLRSAGLLAASVLLCPVVRAQGGALFDRVVAALAKSYYDKEFRTDRLPELAAKYRAAAHAAATRDEERAVVGGLLAEIPASHLALYSAASHKRLLGELGGRKRAPTVGCELTQRAGRFFVHSVYDGGPAEQAGVLRGDRVLAIDGVPTGASPRLDWRTDDAHLADAPIHALLCDADESVALRLERSPGAQLEVTVEVADYSAFEASKASARVVERDGRRFGYVHLWMVFISGPDRLVRELLEGEFADCDGLILDLRGRGGNGMVVHSIIDQFAGSRTEWDKPVAALIDRDTRSAKEVIAFEIRRRKAGVLIGERTAGAVIPATFEKVADDAVLMFPSFTLGNYTAKLEGVGVAPDVAVEVDYEYSAGRDPILEAALTELAAGRIARPGQR
jgi:carboxyl-terminal processing protease